MDSQSSAGEEDIGKELKNIESATLLHKDLGSELMFTSDPENYEVNIVGPPSRLSGFDSYSAVTIQADRANDDLSDEFGSPKSCGWFKRICRGIRDYLAFVFSFPYCVQPISFKAESKTKTPSLPSDEVEDLINFSEQSKELFDIVLRQRREVVESKYRHENQDVDASAFPGWTSNNIARLKSIFKIFDFTDDGLIDFEEWSSVLTEFGDRSSENVRRRHFEDVDPDNSDAIDFQEFLEMWYKLTYLEGDDRSDPETIELSSSIKAIDHNMAHIRSLNIVQQLQVGLF